MLKPASHLPKSNRKVLWLAILSSLFIHIVFAWKLSDFQTRDQSLLPTEPNKVKVKYVEKKVQEPLKQIVESPMEPTKPPEKADYLGAQDHQAKKQTKVKPSPQKPGMDPGQGGASDKQSDAFEKPPELKPASSPTKARNAYEALMPTAQDMQAQRLRGYQDYVEDDLAIGDKVDLNTRNYRYIGYLTSIRKAFELVWTYPSEAARVGMQGQVRVEFTIEKSGRVVAIKIVESSGFDVLDQGVIEAIELSSPYAPLPDGFSKETLTVVGSFHYVLSSFAGAY